MPTRKTLNIGAFANDGTGDTLRDASDKINYNFDQLFDRLNLESTTSNSVISDESGIVLFPQTPSSNSLPDGINIGDMKYFVNISSGTAKIVGNYGGGTELSLSGNSACQIIWVGTSWMLFSDSGVSIT